MVLFQFPTGIRVISTNKKLLNMHKSITCFNSLRELELFLLGDTVEDGTSFPYSFNSLRELELFLRGTVIKVSARIWVVSIPYGN